MGTKSCKVLEISQHTKDTSKNFKHVIGGHHSRINSIKFDKISNDDGTSSIEIVTCSKDKKLCRWDLNGTLINTISVGENTSCLAITYSFKPQNKKKTKKYVMVASNNINIWNISNKDNYKVLGSLQGQASLTRFMKLSEDNEYLISGGQGRYIYIFKCKSFYKKKQLDGGNKLKSAEYSLPLDDDVICIDIKTITKPLSEDEI